MKLIVGLGNPGPRYETTRHNVGFLAIDRLIDAWGAELKPSKHDAEIYEANISGQKTLLIKPLTYMNLSGRAVGPLFHYLKLNAEDLIVIHDEVDLPIHTFKIKQGGGTAGHNGLKSIDENIGNENNAYYRVRIGIGHPRHFEDDRKKMETADYVLGQLGQDEADLFDKVFDQVVQAIQMIIQGQAKEAMNKFHRKEV